MGGKGHAGEVLEIVGSKMSGLFGSEDKQLLRSGTPRWRHTAHWARYRLVQRGLLRNDSPRGVWELTEQGIRLVEGGEGF